MKKSTKKLLSDENIISVFMTFELRLAGSATKDDTRFDLDPKTVSS
jgi:hypothetical protein